MFNHEQKINFLNTITNDNSYRSFLRVFKAVEDIEERFGKDVCDMSVEEIMIVLDLKTGTRYNNTIQSMSLLRTYVNWCIQNGKTSSENNFEKIDAKEIDKTKVYTTKYIGDPSELDEMCSVVFKKDAFYNETLDIPKELVIRLCYVGMEDREIVMLKKTDVDFDKMELKSPLYEGIVYKVDSHILSLVGYCMNQEELVYSAPSRGTSARAERLCNNEYVLRPRIGTLRGKPESTPMSHINVIRRVKELCDKYYESTDIYKELTPAKLRESGLMYRIKSSGDPVGYMDTILKNDISARIGCGNSRKISEKVRLTKETYNTWSNIF